MLTGGRTDSYGAAVPAPQGEQTNVRTRLAQQRVASGYTQRDMARLTGLSLTMYRRLERGEIDNPGVRWPVNYARVLKVSTNLLMEPAWTEWLVVEHGPKAEPDELPPARRQPRG